MRVPLHGALQPALPGQLYDPQGGVRINPIFVQAPLEFRLYYSVRGYLVSSC